jgi:hypothetical protein
MGEFVTILTGLTVNDRSVTCDHAVLIKSEETSVSDWVISILGIGYGDLATLAASRRFSASGPRGEWYSGQVRTDGGLGHFHARLVGQGVLRQLRDAGPKAGKAGVELPAASTASSA